MAFWAACNRPLPSDAGQNRQPSVKIDPLALIRNAGRRSSDPGDVLPDARAASST